MSIGEALKRVWEANRKSKSELDLARLSLKKLPLKLGLLTQLQELSLNSNQLISLPPEIGRLAQLKMLDVNSNQLTSLPPEIGQLTQLKMLDIGRNQLTSLPPEIGQLTQLKTLDIGSNQLSPSEIGQLAQLKTLRTLIIDQNQLASLPPEIGRLPQLTSLSVTSNRLTSLPPEIGQLTQLNTLNINSNRLTSLPPEIGQLPQLTSLDLSCNRLRSLPQGLRLDSFDFLDLRQNPLPEREPLSEILRSIEFPPEYRTAGMSVLSYFGRFVEQKYPGLDVAVSIHQEGNIVSMTIETPDGSRETVEKALVEYGLVVTEEKTPEEILDDKLAIVELKTQLRLQKAQIESLRDIGLLKDETIAGLNLHLAAAISRETPIYVGARATAQAQTIVDFNFPSNLAQLQGTLSELEKALPEGKERQTVQETAAALDEIVGESDPAKVRKSGAWSKLRRFAKKLSKGKDAVRKTIEEVKDGRDMVQEIETLVGKIGQWLESAGPGALGG